MQQLNPSEISDIIKERIAEALLRKLATRAPLSAFRRYCSNSRSACSKRRNDQFPGNLFGFALNWSEMGRCGGAG